jgi:2,4-dienoyl-CoA reductase-like NADH-dependent reductase (Old Yellow Enzyme family)
MPLFLRVSATEWLEYTGEPSWDLESTIRLAKTLPALGVDLLDVSSAGNNPKQKIRMGDPFYQSDLAGKIRAAVKEEGLNLLIGAVGMINVPERARLTVQDGPLEGQEEGKIEPPRADLCLVGKQFLREPNWVLKVGDALGVPLQKPVQYGYVLKHRM